MIASSPRPIGTTRGHSPGRDESPRYRMIYSSKQVLQFPRDTSSILEHRPSVHAASLSS